MRVADLVSVQKTRLLPLWGREVESQRPHPMLVDEAAVRIVNELGYDFSTIAARMSRITPDGMGMPLRAYRPDSARIPRTVS
jgi:O-methyltransferase involved in polyketide biosynthesis